MKELTVILVTYKSRHVIDDCLGSIARFNDIGEGLEVIAVDNSPSEDDTYAHLMTRYPWVRSIRNPANKGFGQGNNVGAKTAGGECLLFLNPDTILIEPVFSFLLGQFKADPALGMLGFTLVTPTGKPTNSFGVMPEKRGIIPLRVYRLLIGIGITPRCVFPWGAALAIPRSLFLDAGGFDEAIFLGHEEPDLVRRIGGSRVRIAKKKIVHLDGHAIGKPEERLRDFLSAQEYYFRKYALDYRRHARYVHMSLSAKRACRGLVGRGLSASEQMLLKHYRSVLRGS
jgi:GT2 family glycosyltransferase